MNPFFFFSEGVLSLWNGASMVITRAVLVTLSQVLPSQYNICDHCVKWGVPEYMNIAYTTPHTFSFEYTIMIIAIEYSVQQDCAFIYTPAFVWSRSHVDQFLVLTDSVLRAGQAGPPRHRLLQR